MRFFGPVETKLLTFFLFHLCFEIFKYAFINFFFFTFRTNPHCSSRTATTFNSGTILKPTFIDITNDGDNEARFVAPITSSGRSNSDEGAQSNSIIGSKEKGKINVGIDNDNNNVNNYDGDDAADVDDVDNTVKECGTNWSFTENGLRFYLFLCSNF